MQARQGERVFLRGVYKDVNDPIKTESNAVLRSIYAFYLSKSFKVFEVKNFIITSSSSLNNGKVIQVPEFSQPVSIQETGASEPSPERRISATVYSSAFLASLYPPLFPRALTTKPAAESEAAEASRYLSDSFWRSAMSEREMYPSPYIFIYV